MPSPLGKVRPSGNPSFASGKTGVLSILWPKYEDLQKVVGILPLPNGELFQVHGSKFKLHPVCYLSQACVSRISHAMLFFGIRRDPFNGFLHRLQSPSLLRPAHGGQVVGQRDASKRWPVPPQFRYTVIVADNVDAVTTRLETKMGSFLFGHERI